MTRVFVIVLDSLGVGALPDAADFGDVGAHTLDHIAAGMGEHFAIPRLVELGLGHVPGVTGIARTQLALAATGRCLESSPGKDTSTGHWEMMACGLDQGFPVYKDGFPAEIIDEFVRRCDLPGVLCNAPASGTEVIERLGVEHIATGKPIVYTSADSVFQVAAHEEHYGIDRLIEHCQIAREMFDPLGLGRIIARPFVGKPGSFKRTYNRRDFSLLPPHATSLDRLKEAGVEVVGVGKIEDIFAGLGVTQSIHTEGNRDGMQHTIRVARELDAGFVFVNLVDFDMLFGHRRDVTGYGRALEEFDIDLCALEVELREGDLVILTADHGNDPSHPVGTDHTREYIPIVAWHHGQGGAAGIDLGTRSSFADIGATVEASFGLTATEGASFLSDLRGRVAAEGS
jgi:phosphopentomutase